MALLMSFFPRMFFASASCRRSRFWLATFAVSTLFASRSWAQGEFKEYQLKAVFLFNFAQFVQWPDSAFADADSPLTIGVLGDDPFDGLLDDIVRGERSGGRKIVVRRTHRVEEVNDCQVLFICKSESAHLESILRALDNRPLLTVSDVDRAARRGTMIRFVTEKKKIRLRVNLDATKRAGLVVSSKILRAAEIVTTSKDQP